MPLGQGVPGGREERRGLVEVCSVTPSRELIQSALVFPEFPQQHYPH